MTMIKVNNVSKSYGSLRAVDALNLTIGSGAAFGLLGPNGAGKSTTISMLSGLFPPDEGSISIGGHDLWQEPMSARRLMGIVPQDVALYPALSALENVAFFGRLHGLRGTELRKRCQEVLELVGLWDRAKEPVKSYSGGMKRRVNIAAGLVHSPQLLLLDEPTVGVDPQSRRAILDVIKELNSNGMTVLYTSHYMEEVAELCSYIAVMDKGHIIAQGTQAELHNLLGDSDFIRIESAEPLTDVSFLETMPGVKRVAVKGAELTLTVRNGAQALAVIVNALAARNVEITGLKVEQANLEAVFLHLTGRTLRD
ncbi:MAG TPA: ABC transporter ATP-binding protein [Bacillota bacterium]|nr:ABC transporter ATP-binding protein [Bacillota bacterium]